MSFDNKLDGLSDLEIRILKHFFEKRYRFIAFNNGHARVFNSEVEPVLKGAMYRVEQGKSTYFGESIFIPGLFQDKGFDVIDLSTLTYQESLF